MKLTVACGARSLSAMPLGVLKMLLRTAVFLAIGPCLLWCAPQHSPVPDQAQPRSLTLHLADYCEGPSPHRLRYQRHPNDAPLCAERAYRLDERDFTTASMGTDSIGAPAVNLCFNATGRAKFQRLVLENVGRWIVFIHKGKLLLATRIQSSDVAECAMIEGFVEPSDAVALQLAIMGR